MLPLQQLLDEHTSASPLADRPPRVLYLNEERSDFEQAQARLVADGISAEIVRLGSRAEFLAALRGGRCDVIVADCALPWLDCLSAIRMARSKNPDTPFILISETASQELLDAVLQQDATSLLLTEHLAQLPSKVRRALHDIERSAAEQQVRRRLNVEQAVAGLLSEPKTANEMVPQIIRTICHHMGWHLGMYWRLEKSLQVLRCTHVWHAPHMNMTAFDELSRSISLPCGQGLPGRVWVTGEPAWISDTSDVGSFPRMAAAVQDALYSAMAFPVRCDGSLIGILEFFSRERRAPDPAQIHLMGRSWLPHRASLQPHGD